MQKKGTLGGPYENPIARIKRGLVQAEFGCTIFRATKRAGFSYCLFFTSGAPNLAKSSFAMAAPASPVKPMSKYTSVISIFLNRLRALLLRCAYYIAREVIIQMHYMHQLYA